MRPFCLFVSALAAGAICLSQVQADPRSLPMAEAVQLGLAANTGLRVQQNETEKAELDVRIARSYAYPEVSLFSGLTYVEPRPGIKKEIIPGVPPLELNIGRNNNLSHGAQIRYILYEGGRRTHIREASENVREASRWLLLDRRRTVEYDVRTAYLGVLLAKEMLRLAEENLERSVVRGKDAASAFKAGSIPRIELLRAQAEEADGAVTVDEARDRLRMAHRQLMILINAGAAEMEPGGSLADAAGAITSFDLTSLRNREPEFAKLMAAGFQRRAAEETAEAKRGELFPTVVTGLKMAQTNPYRGESRYGPDVSAFVQISYPIFDSGRAADSYEKARLDAQSAMLQQDELARSLRSYYALLMDRIDSLHRSLAARRIGIERASASRDAAHVAWKNGSIDLSRLLDAEVLLTRARVDYYRTTADLYGTLADWERWSGSSTGTFDIFQ